MRLTTVFPLAVLATACGLVKIDVHTSSPKNPTTNSSAASAGPAQASAEQATMQGAGPAQASAEQATTPGAGETTLHTNERAEQASAARAQLDKSFALDRAAAERAQVSLTVWGITLGAPLDLPVCEPHARPMDSRCVDQQDAWDQLDQNLFIAGELVAPEGMKDELVNLGPGGCPSWTGCQVVVTTMEGIAMAVYFITQGATEQDAIEKKLSKDYRRPPELLAPAQCVERRKVGESGTTVYYQDFPYSAPRRHWALEALDVVYSPYGNATNCSIGLIAVRSGTYLRLTKS